MIIVNNNPWNIQLNIYIAPLYIMTVTLMSNCALSNCSIYINQSNKLWKVWTKHFAVQGEHLTNSPLTGSSLPKRAYTHKHLHTHHHQHTSTHRDTYICRSLYLLHTCMSMSISNAHIFYACILPPAWTIIYSMCVSVSVCLCLCLCSCMCVYVRMCSTITYMNSA